MENLISTKDLYLVIEEKEERIYSIARKKNFKYYDIFTDMECEKSNEITPIHVKSEYLSKQSIKEALDEWNPKKPCKKLIKK